MNQWMTWELLDWLSESGWALAPAPPRQKIAALTLTPGIQQVGTVFYNKQLEVCHQYVLVLAQNQCLANKGVQQIRHKEKVSYYKALSNILTGDEMPRPLGRLHDDGNLLHDVVGQQGSAGALIAIQDMAARSDHGQSSESEASGDPDC